MRRAWRPHADNPHPKLPGDEVGSLLAAIDALPTTEPYGLMARLLYGDVLRLMECSAPSGPLADARGSAGSFGILQFASCIAPVTAPWHTALPPG
jgi:hypothetical protein